MDPTTQYYWLGYQIYTVITMHVARLLRFTGCSRTEERIAKLLNCEKRVILRSKDGSAVSATQEATSVQDGRDRVKKIILDHGPGPYHLQKEGSISTTSSQIRNLPAI
jgi:hypothetical protein